MIYCTSDLHGLSVQSFKSLLNKVSFSDSDYLFILGDVIDRGEHSGELLKWLLLQPNIELLLGNHEDMLLSCRFIFSEVTDDSIQIFDDEKMERLANWYYNGAEPTMRSLRELNRTDRETMMAILDYLDEAPLYEEITVGGRDFVLAHSIPERFDDALPLYIYDKHEWLWSRPSLDMPINTKKNLVFGHTPTVYYGDEHSGRILRRDNLIDIDTGGTAALLRLDDLAEFYL